MDDIIPRHKWNILGYIGSPFHNLTALQKNVLRKQLNEKYCHCCGEYIYNPYRKRKIRHYHHHRYTVRYKPILYERILIYPQTQLVEWTRRFPHVMRLVLSEKDMFFYNNFRSRFVHRIPSLRMWTIDEWNTIYPDAEIDADDCLKKLINHRTTMDIMHTPSLVL